MTRRTRRWRGCALPPGWRRRTAASRCSAAASATSMRWAFARPRPAFFPRPSGLLERERLANAAASSFGPRFNDKPEGPDMTTSTIATAPYEDLAAAVRGSVILPGDPEYDQARAVYNGMIDKHPAAIARCRDVADVITCVRFAREHGVEIAVRSGGHSAAGLGVWDGALVIDLSLLRSTTVSPEDHTVRVDAGCTWGDVDHATVAFGMATPSGFLSSTGVAGLTLGGGVGYLSRRFGLTVDSLLSADVVLAD